MGNGWTLERRKRQAELIKQWTPWQEFTGPQSPEGKEAVSRNAWRAAHRQQPLELSKMVNAEISQARELVATCCA